MNKSENFSSIISARREAKGLTADGREVPDSTPMAPPVGYVKQKTITERIREMVRSEHLRRAAEEAGAETFEEADDFNVPDDLEPASGYENDDIFEPEPAPAAAPSPGPVTSDDPSASDPEVSTGGSSPPGGGGKGGGATSTAEGAPLPNSRKPVSGSPKRS